MPTLKPRISITLDEDDLAVLDRYAAASGKPRASMIAQLIHSTIPELRRASELMELANAAPAGVIRGLVDDLSNATADAMGFLRPFHADYQHVLDGLDSELSAGLRDHEKSVRAGTSVDASAPASGPARKRSPGPGDPHLLTGGSKR